MTFALPLIGLFYIIKIINGGRVNIFASGVIYYYMMGLKKICKFLRRKLGMLARIRRKAFGLLSVILGLLLIFIAAGIVIKAFNKASGMLDTFKVNINTATGKMEGHSQENNLDNNQ
jgi:hypothetical protein